MMENMFTNTHILAWLQYYADHTRIDLERVKILDITRKNKNLIPTVESHSCVLVFTEAGHPDIFYRMFNAGLGECTVIYNEGSDPAGPILENKVYDMIDRGINASAAMLVLNPNARSTIRFGMDNLSFTPGSVHYVGSEIRAVILSKLQVSPQKNLCIISGESIAIEAANLAPEGTVIAVEYSGRDRRTLEDNVAQFGLNNVEIIDRVSPDTLSDLPVPEAAMLVASASTEQEMGCLLQRNPAIEFVIYTLDFGAAAGMDEMCRRLGLEEPEIIQISVAKRTAKNTFDAEPAPWLITCKGKD